MKQLSVLLALYLTIAGTGQCFAQDKKDDKQAAIADAVNSQRYVFRATTALPMRGRTVSLSSDYSMTVTKDTVVAYLPYFGRAYTAPIGQNSNGIDFTSTDFTYSAAQKKKGGWEVDIKPKDKREIQALFLTISKNGYGNLNVTLLNKQSISFSGTVEKLTP